MSIPELVGIVGIVVSVCLVGVSVLAALATFGAKLATQRRNYAIFALVSGALSPLAYFYPVVMALVFVAMLALALLKEAIRPGGAKP